MNSLGVSVLLFVVASPLTGISSQSAFLKADTEAPILLPGGGTSFAMPENEYRKIADQLSKASRIVFVPITQKPQRLTAGARFGFNLSFGGFNRSWILDGNEEQGYVLYADLNVNGNLADDPALKFELDKGKHSLLLRTTAREKVDGNEQSYPVEIRLEVNKVIPPGKTEPQLALKVYSRTRRQGLIQVGERKIAFALTGTQGIYNLKYNRVYFDLTGDKQLGSSESYSIWEKYVNIGDRSYEFDVDRYGRSLTLKPLAEKLPDRAVLQPGTQAPEFTFKDIDGKSGRLSDFRGKVILLDFWGIWCAPCVAEAPKLVATYRQLHEKGFEIIGVHSGGEITGLRKFIAERDMNWTHVIEDDDGVLHRLYRVEAWPTYYLVGKDGMILSNNLRPGDPLIKEIEKQFGQK